MLNFILYLFNKKYQVYDNKITIINKERIKVASSILFQNDSKYNNNFTSVITNSSSVTEEQVLSKNTINNRLVHLKIKQNVDQFFANEKNQERLQSLFENQDFRKDYLKYCFLGDRFEQFSDYINNILINDSEEIKSSIIDLLIKAPLHRNNNLDSVYGFEKYNTNSIKVILTIIYPSKIIMINEITNILNSSPKYEFLNKNYVASVINDLENIKSENFLVGNNNQQKLMNSFSADLEKSSIDNSDLVKNLDLINDKINNNDLDKIKELIVIKDIIFYLYNLSKSNMSIKHIKEIMGNIYNDLSTRDDFKDILNEESILKNPNIFNKVDNTGNTNLLDILKLILNKLERYEINFMCFDYMVLDTKILKNYYAKIYYILHVILFTQLLKIKELDEIRVKVYSLTYAINSNLKDIELNNTQLTKCQEEIKQQIDSIISCLYKEEKKYKMPIKHMKINTQGLYPIIEIGYSK